MASGKSNNFAWGLYQNLPTLTKPRTDLIALFILSILKVGTVNLVKISVAMGSKAQSKSNYRRLQRFIDQVIPFGVGCAYVAVLLWLCHKSW